LRKIKEQGKSQPENLVLKLKEKVQQEKENPSAPQAREKVQ
jgi:hypothetical protein